MKFLVMVAALAAGGLVHGDEIVLKDGKRLVWKSIVDNGDSYDVEDGTGRHLTLKKDDVDRIEKSLAAPPLTGATFTFDKKRKLAIINLLAAVDPQKHVVTGRWRFAKGTLIGTAGNDTNSRIELPAPLPEEYDLTLEVVRKEGAGDFDVGLVAGGRQFIVAFDAADCVLSGIGIIDGKPIDQHGRAVKGKFFSNGKPRTIICMVRKNGLVIQADGKDFLSYADGWEKLSLHPAHAITSQERPFFVVWRGTFEVSKAILMAPR